MDITNYLIFGSRDFDDYELFRNECSMRFYNDHEFRRTSHFFTGDARGTDSLVMQFCDEEHLIYDCYRAYWNKYGNSAGVLRNVKLADAAFRRKCEAFCFWDGKSRGTAHMIKYLQSTKRPFDIIFVEKVDGAWRRKAEQPIAA